MFRRKTTVEVEGEICPYCEFVNKAGSTTCSQCYYDLNKSPRDQGESISTELSNSIFDELMSDEDDSWEEGDALDVVLSLDQDPLEVKQYEATDFESEEPEKIGFMESSSPEMHDTVSHEPEEVVAEDVGEEIKNVPKLDFSKTDPFDEVPEPVHQGKGTVFSPSTPTKLDDDLMGHVGGLELPSLPPDNLYENKIDLSAKRAPAPTPAAVLPNLPTTQVPTPAVELPKPVATPVVQPTPQVDVNPNNSTETAPATPHIEESGVAIQEQEIPEDIHKTQILGVEEEAAEEINLPKEVPEIEPPQAIPPTPEANSRIWPWPEGEPWDARQVHREVVSALELVKSGKRDEAASTIDSLGPHLTDENIDLIYHIGMVLKQLERSEEVKTMLTRANSQMPGNQHVSSAMAHLGV